MNLYRVNVLQRWEQQQLPKSVTNTWLTFMLVAATSPNNNRPHCSNQTCDDTINARSVNLIEDGSSVRLGEKIRTVYMGHSKRLRIKGTVESRDFWHPCFSCKLYIVSVTDIKASDLCFHSCLHIHSSARIHRCAALLTSYIINAPAAVFTTARRSW